MAKEAKTNAMRMLDRQKVKYETLAYECDEFIDGLHSADLIGAPYDQSFKTLVMEGKSGGCYVFVVPIEKEVDRKAAAKAVGEKMGVDVEVKPIDWDSKDMELSSGKIDVIWNGFSITDERRQEVLFSNPYLSTKQSIVVKKGSDITKKADLAGKKIALQDGSTSEDALKADTATYESVGDDNISRFKENSQVLMEVDSGRADAAVIDEVFVRYYLQKENLLDKYTVLEEGFDEEDYGVGGRKGDYALMEAINKALDECKADGTTSEISQKWFGEDLIK